jgi:hypothetical protein
LDQVDGGAGLAAADFNDAAVRDLVPAIVELVGDLIWWPAKPEFHGVFAGRERSEELDNTAV